jgi:eukaryotic-like serine/threonine-protein kinase
MHECSKGDLIGGRYQLQARLGEGGMGSVWEATHTITRGRHALKFLRGHHGHRDDLRQRFVREARAASMVRHPNVVEVRDLFELEDGTLVMVMELLEGCTLGERMRQARQLSLPEITSYLVPAVSAVGTAHALGIVHRDLKPENIFLAGSAHAPDVRVLDFGIAKLVEPEASAGITRTGALLGTPCYMSPEQALGEGTADHRVDIWSFGVILYEALAGARPVEGENLGQLLRRLAHDGITPIEVIVPELPKDVTDLVGRMLSQDCEDRPGDLGQVMAVLERHTSVRAPGFGPPTHRPPQALAVTNDAAVATTDALLPEAAPERAADASGPVGAPAVRWGRRGLATAGVIAAIGAATWLARGPASNPAPATTAEALAPTAAAALPVSTPTDDMSGSLDDGQRIEPPRDPSAARVAPEPKRRPSVARAAKAAMPAAHSMAKAVESAPVPARSPSRPAEDGFVDDPPF